MIAFLKGTLAGKTPTTVFLDVHGVGFALGVSQTTLSKLPEVGAPAQLYTYMQVREDAMTLFGFLSLEEKALFERLISVSGVGPKVALAALSAYAPDSLANAIASQDVAAVQRIPGVGKKTASRIILELKGSLDQGLAGLFDEGSPAQTVNVHLQAAHEALLSMGFTSAEADLALKDAPEGAAEGALLQYALKRLGSQS